MPRSTDEWIGKTDDSMPSPKVRLRIFNAYKGCCYRSGKKIRAGDKWDLDHIKALCNGGENRESNLAPILKEEHKSKTRDDRTEKKKTDRLRAAHFGMKPKKNKSRLTSRYNRELGRFAPYDRVKNEFVKCN